MLEFRSAARFASVPFVESGISRCGRIYSGMKGSSALFARCCALAELSAGVSVSLLARPALRRLAGPLEALDGLLCALLESVERAAPSVYLPPEMMLSSAQEYVSCRIVEPVLKRADSVKRIGSRAADGLDGALDAADLYVDKYLPPDGREEPRAPAAGAAEEPGAHRAVRTIRHVDRLTRKLSRRLTRRTLREARALGEHTAEAIHVLAYAAELVSLDPVPSPGSRSPSPLSAFVSGRRRPEGGLARGEAALGDAQRGRAGEPGAPGHPRAPRRHADEGDGQARRPLRQLRRARDRRAARGNVAPAAAPPASPVRADRESQIGSRRKDSPPPGVREDGSAAASRRAPGASRHLHRRKLRKREAAVSRESPLVRREQRPQRSQLSDPREPPPRFCDCLILILFHPRRLRRRVFIVFFNPM